MKTKDLEDTADDVVLEDSQLICALTKKIKAANEKELTLQSMIMMLNEEYNFDLKDMERDFPFSYEDDEGKTKRAKADLAVFETGKAHELENMIRIAVVFDSKVKDKDSKKGVTKTLGTYLEYTECEFGVWTNGNDLHYLQCERDEFGQAQTTDISDFPGAGQTMDDLEQQGERAHPRKPANDSLVKTFKRCHDYIYGNEGMKKTAFWELLNLIFCKIYDEKRRFIDAEKGFSYRRKFWVGVKEQNTKEGQEKVTSRIKGLFEELKHDDLFKEVFDGNEQINLSPRGLAYVASELAKYSFLDATIDVKGTAYETIVSNTLKQEAGQFFTPRNVIRCMVEMMDPDQNTRVLDPACGSGGFLVMVLDHVRKKIAQSQYTRESGIHLEGRYNAQDVVSLVKGYAEQMLFGFDFDPDLKKAARMNMVMAGDGHANIFNINSLDYPKGQLTDTGKVGPKVAESISISQDKDFPFEKYPMEDARGKFDMIFTNPPFGAKVMVDRSISREYDLGHNPLKDPYSNYVFNGSEKSSEAPEVLFIEQCYNFLKPGGKMAIVLPDGILGNPNTESVRAWILEHFKLLASVDLPVETFLPQVGVQASLLFLQKKTAAEKLVAVADENYDVFMAIVEAVGKDRRGVPVYVRDEDGAELLFERKKEWLSMDEKGNLIPKSRIGRERQLDDDLPKVSEAYKKFLSKISDEDNENKE